jgi:hypothetical protein
MRRGDGTVAPRTGGVDFVVFMDLFNDGKVG